MLPALANAQGTSNNAPFYVYSTSTQVNNQALYIPVNSSGMESYPLWHIVFETQGNFVLTNNGSIVDQGYASAGYTASFLWTYNQTQGNVISPQLTINGQTYNFTDIQFTQILTPNIFESVSITSTYPQQQQLLSAQAGQSGVLMYPNWNITLISSITAPYVILEDNKIVNNGTITGSKHILMKMNGSQVSLIVSIGAKQFKFLNEPIASVPLQKYYQPPSPPLVSTALQDLIQGVRYIAGGIHHLVRRINRCP